MGNDITPPRAWTARLNESPASGSSAELHPIERRAVDSAVPFAAEHARRYIATAGQDDAWDGPRPILLLYTVGRRSGEIRRNPLLFFDHDGGRHVVGSKGGDVRDPLWFANLVAQPAVHVRVDGEFYPATAEVLAAPERALVWPALTERYPVFAGCQERTEREIPLVRLRRVDDPADPADAADPAAERDGYPASPA